MKLKRTHSLFSADKSMKVLTFNHQTRELSIVPNRESIMNKSKRENIYYTDILEVIDPYSAQEI